MTYMMPNTRLNGIPNTLCSSTLYTINEINRASPKPRACQPGTNGPALSSGDIHQAVQLRRADLVKVSQAGMTGIHQLSESHFIPLV